MQSSSRRVPRTLRILLIGLCCLAITGERLAAQDLEAPVPLPPPPWEAENFPQEQMQILLAEEATIEDKRSAAAHLALYGDGGFIWQARGMAEWSIDRENVVLLRNAPNPLCEEFENPTLAEAILDLMIEDVPGSRRHAEEGSLAQKEVFYLTLLLAVGDERITPRLAALFEDQTGKFLRRQMAHTCKELGEEGPWNTLVADLAAGTLFDPEDMENGLLNEEAQEELLETLRLLASVDSDESQQATWAVVDPELPYYATVAANLSLVRGRLAFEAKRWFEHPSCVMVFRELMNDDSETEFHSSIRLGIWRREGKDWWRETAAPSWLGEQYRERTLEHAYDEPARVVSTLIFGVPQYHVLAVDAQERIERLIALLDSYGTRYRRLKYYELQLLLPGSYSYELRYIPDLGQLGHPATAEDFESGRALFHLEGRGELANLELPAIAVVPSDSTEEDAPPQRGLIVQAERESESGEITYGIIFREGPMVLGEDSLTEILPIEVPQPGNFQHVPAGGVIEPSSPTPPAP